MPFDVIIMMCQTSSSPLAIVRSIALLSLGIQILDALHISDSVLRRTASRGQMTMKVEIAPRKVNRLH